ncbi:MAG: SCO family protein [Emcibacter sp.]|nr:SCO family protein [Emcibacter sp.]
MSVSKTILILFAMLASFLAAYITLYTPDMSKDKTTTAGQNTKALIGGPFSLINHHGKSVSYADFKGKYMLIYFGYTYCPDVCPMELQIMSDALDLSPAEILSEINPIFITVDPERDTVEIMAQYVPAFHPAMIGLTGSPEQVSGVTKAYRVYAAKENSEDPDAYLVSHSSYIYLMDREGDYVTHFKSRTDPKVMAQRLQEIIR